MWLIEQRRAGYGNADMVWVVHDARLALGLFSEERRHHYEMKVLQILQTDPTKWAKVRNALFGAKDAVVGGYKLDTSHLVWADKTHQNYHKLFALREVLLSNPTATLSALDSAITDALAPFWIDSSDIETIADIVDKTTEESFWDHCDDVEKRIWHTWLTFFLEWIITSGKFIEKCITKAKQWMSQFSDTKKSFEYWNFRNVLRLWETRQKLSSEGQARNEKSFVLSGGSWNTLAWLWVIKAHLDAGGSIRMISWTSMWATIWAFVGMIGNDTARLSEFMKDIQNGFHSDWSWQHLPDHAYNGKKMVAFLRVLWRKWWIDAHTRFSDLKIPVVVNAWRQYNNGEQEILLWWNDKILESLLVSMNIPFPLLSNTWLLWRHKIDDTAMIDYAANERWNPTHWVQSLGVADRSIYVVDTGYSSEEWTESYGTGTRARFPRATERDFSAKLRISQNGWPVSNFNPEPSWNKWWTKLSPEIIGKLYEIWTADYTSNSSSQE